MTSQEQVPFKKPYRGQIMISLFFILLLLILLAAAYGFVRQYLLSTS